MRKKNLISSIAFLVIGICYSYLTFWIPIRTLPNTPGPSFFPWVIAICFFILSFLLLINNLITKKEEKEEKKEIFEKSFCTYFVNIYLYFTTPFNWFSIYYSFFLRRFYVSRIRKKIFLYFNFFTINNSFYFLFI